MTDLQTLTQLAKSHSQKGEFALAIPYLRQALDRSPPNEAELQADLGIALHQTGQIKQAVMFYGRSLDKAPNAPTILLFRGTALLKLRRFQDALRDFNEAIRLSPYLEDAYWGRGQAYLGLNDAEWAIASFARAIELDPDAPEYYEARAMALKQTGQLFEARQDEQKATELRSP